MTLDIEPLSNPERLPIAKGGEKTLYDPWQDEILIGAEYLATPDIIGRHTLTFVCPHIGGESQADTKAIQRIQHSLPPEVADKTRYLEFAVHRESYQVHTSTLIIHPNALSAVITHISQSAVQSDVKGKEKKLLHSYLEELRGYQRDQTEMRDADPDMAATVSTVVDTLWNMVHALDFETQGTVPITDRTEVHEYAHRVSVSHRWNGQIRRMDDVVRTLQKEQFASHLNALVKHPHPTRQKEGLDASQRVVRIKKIHDFIDGALEAEAILHETLGQREVIGMQQYDHRYMLRRFASIVRAYQRMQDNTPAINLALHGERIRVGRHDKFLQHEIGTVLLLFAESIDPDQLAQDLNLVRAITKSDQNSTFTEAKRQLLERLQTAIEHPDAVATHLVNEEPKIVAILDALRSRFNEEVTSLIDMYPQFFLKEATWAPKSYALWISEGQTKTQYTLDDLKFD